MNIIEAKKLHKKLWNWLAENPEKCKKDWPEWKFNGGKIKEVINECFGCELRSPGKACLVCPIKWLGHDCINESEYADDKGLFARWEMGTKTERQKLAKQIANLPWRVK